MLKVNVLENNVLRDLLKHDSTCTLSYSRTVFCLLFWALTVFCTHHASCLLAEKTAASLDSDSGTSLLVVPDPFGTLELSNVPGK